MSSLDVLAEAAKFIQDDEGNSMGDASPQSGLRSFGSNRQATRSQSRETHNRLEKNRRAELKNYFQRLKNNIPKLMSKHKASTVCILTEAQYYIEELRSIDKQNERERISLHRSRICLEERLKMLKIEINRMYQNKQLTPQPVSPGSDSDLTEMEIEVKDDSEDDNEEKNDDVKNVVDTTVLASKDDAKTFVDVTALKGKNDEKNASDLTTVKAEDDAKKVVDVTTLKGNSDVKNTADIVTSKSEKNVKKFIDVTKLVGKKDIQNAIDDSSLKRKDDAKSDFDVATSKRQRKETASVEIQANEDEIQAENLPLVFPRLPKLSESAARFDITALNSDDEEVESSTDVKIEDNLVPSTNSQQSHLASKIEMSTPKILNIPTVLIPSVFVNAVSSLPVTSTFSTVTTVSTTSVTHCNTSAVVTNPMLTTSSTLACPTALPSTVPQNLSPIKIENLENLPLSLQILSNTCVSSGLKSVSTLQGSVNAAVSAVFDDLTKKSKQTISTATATTTTVRVESPIKMQDLLPNISHDHALKIQNISYAPLTASNQSVFNVDQKGITSITNAPLSTTPIITSTLSTSSISVTSSKPSKIILTTAFNTDFTVTKLKNFVGTSSSKSGEALPKLKNVYTTPKPRNTKQNNSKTKNVVFTPVSQSIPNLQGMVFVPSTNAGETAKLHNFFYAPVSGIFTPSTKTTGTQSLTKVQNIVYTPACNIFTPAATIGQSLPKQQNVVLTPTTSTDQSLTKLQSMVYRVGNIEMNVPIAVTTVLSCAPIHLTTNTALSNATTSNIEPLKIDRVSALHQVDRVGAFPQVVNLQFLQPAKEQSRQDESLDSNVKLSEG